MTTSAQKTRLVLVEITVSSPTHCSNNCRFMETHRAGVCTLGGDFETVELQWDRRKKEHGFKRTKDCLNAEAEKS